MTTLYDLIHQRLKPLIDNPIDVFSYDGKSTGQFITYANLAIGTKALSGRLDNCRSENGVISTHALKDKTGRNVWDLRCEKLSSLHNKLLLARVNNQHTVALSNGECMRNYDFNHGDIISVIIQNTDIFYSKDDITYLGGHICNIVAIDNNDFKDWLSSLVIIDQ